MKKLLLWLGVVIGALILTDICFGIAAKHYISNRPLRGDYRNTEHLIKDSVEEFIVLGSSVALNSIDTKRISDSLGITSFNGASNGQTFPYYLTLMEILAKKPEVKTVILGMKEESLCEEGLGSRYNFLIPYYKMGYEGIDRRIESKSSFDKIMLNSSLYRYNTIWFRILLYSFYEPGLQGKNGFIAKDIPAIFPERLIIKDSSKPVTETRKEEFEQFIKQCTDNGIRLIVCIPPRYETHLSANAAEDYLRQRAARGDFELWFDAQNIPQFNDSTMFFDTTHLNYKGAEAYTDLIIERLKK